MEDLKYMKSLSPIKTFFSVISSPKLTLIKN